MISTFIWLLFGHAVADFGFQDNDMMTYKNPSCKRRKAVGPWWLWMLGHGCIHGAMVTLVTGSFVLGLGEAYCHCIIDYGKCKKYYGYAIDQIMHLLCKFIWVLLI